MNTPPLLLAATVLFWGYQSENWIVAGACALLLEAPRYVARRWELSLTEFNRVADFCTVLLFAIAVYLYFSFGNPRAVTLLFQWIPVIVAPLVLAQAWSTTRELELSVLFWSLRRNPPRQVLKLNLGYPMYALWLLAASAANRQGAGFYVGLVLLSAWALLQLRPRSYSTALTVALIGAAGVVGYGGQIGLRALQLWLEGAASEWIIGSGTRTDPYRSTTDIGSIGDLKMSERILLRVQGDAGTKFPLLLHRASYDNYVGGTWVAGNARFEQLAPFGSVSTWKLYDADAVNARIRVHDNSSGNPVLSLPANTARIEGLAASGMKLNPLGTVQVEHRPGFFGYAALVARAPLTPAAPTARDLGMPRAEAAGIAQLSRELGLAALSPRAALARLKQHFGERFEYSTWQGKPAAGAQTALARFLFSTHAGHCEYFATATVLLLRAAGIPARYATGFSAHEWSELEGAYVVRERHAHAWARVWIDGAWEDVDTTPPVWFAAEAAQAPAWAALTDLWSWLRFRIAVWSEQLSERGWTGRLAWLALPLFIWLAWSTLRGRAAKRAVSSASAVAQAQRRGEDSEFYLVERRMAELGQARRETETPQEWLERIAPIAAQDVEGLRRLARLHYRHRFDPAGLPPSERAQLRGESLSWLARHSAPRPG